MSQNTPTSATISQRFVLIWAPRVGTDAAEAYYGAIRNTIVAATLGPIWLTLILIGALANIPALWILGAIVAGAQIVGFSLGWQELRHFKQRASRSLGTTVGWREIPAKQDKYVQWCNSKGIEPLHAVRNTR